MKHYDFIIGPTDTDSISFCKSDMSEFTKEERDILLKEINDLMPEFMIYEADGYFPSAIALKAKNYVLWDGEKKHIKGSAFKTSSKEIALKEFMDEMVDCLLFDKGTIIDIYHKYIKESQNIQDISRWSTKKTVTKAVFESDRPNETKILEALNGESIQEGDKVYLFSTINGVKQKIEKGEPVFLKDGTPKMIPNKILKLSKNWIPGEEDKEHYLNRVYSTLEILSNVIDLTQFIDYGIKKNRHLLLELLNEKT